MPHAAAGTVNIDQLLVLAFYDPDLCHGKNASQTNTSRIASMPPMMNLIFDIPCRGGTGGYGPPLVVQMRYLTG